MGNRSEWSKRSGFLSTLSLSLSLPLVLTQGPIMPRTFHNSSRRLPTREPRPTTALSHASHGSLPATVHGRSQNVRQEQQDRRRSTQLLRVIPPELFHITRAQFAIVKSLHHRNLLEKGLPPSLLKKAAFLTHSVNPAFKTDYFHAVIEEASKTWANSVLLALIDHYSVTIQEAQDFISSNAFPEKLLGSSLGIVHKWARRQLGHKLTDSELDAAINLITRFQRLTPVDCVEDVRGEKAASPSSPASACDRSTQTEPSDASQRPVGESRSVIPVPASASTVSTSTTFSRKRGYTAMQTDSSLSPREAGSCVSERRASCDVPICDASSAIEASTDFLPPSSSLALDSGLATFEEDGEAPPGSIPREQQPPSSDAPPSAPVAALASLVEAVPERSSASPAATGPRGNAGFGPLVLDHGTPNRDRVTRVFKSLDTTKSSMILGDENLKEFVAENTCVIADRAGRLSFFKQVLQRCEPSPSISTFVICVSLLDRANLPNTNFAALRSLLYSAKKAFPNARLGVMMFGAPSGCSSNVAQFTEEFKSLVDSRSPAGCTVLTPPSPFMACSNVLSKATRCAMFSVIHSFLN